MRGLAHASIATSAEPAGRRPRRRPARVHVPPRDASGLIPAANSVNRCDTRGSTVPTASRMDLRRKVVEACARGAQT